MNNPVERGLESLVFWSRWLQAPLYVGLIVAQVLYCYKFALEVWHLCMITGSANENEFLLVVLLLIDIVMVANLITMVVIGGYATFVSKLDVDEHADKPEWLSHIDPGAIKVKLAGSLIGISGVHLLTSFIMLAPQRGPTGEIIVKAVNADQIESMKWQIIIHVVFLISTLLLAITEFVMHRRHRPTGHPGTDRARAANEAIVSNDHH